MNVAGYGNAGTLTVNGGMGLSGDTLNYTVGDQIALTGALTLSGTDYIAPLAKMATGTYTLFTAASVPANPGNDLAMTGIYGANSRTQYTFASSGGTAVTLTVTGGVPGNLQWATSGNGVWYTGTNSTANWYNTTSGSADYFYADDNATLATGPAPPRT